MALLRQVNNPDNGDNTSPAAAGYLQFYKQGFAPSTGFQVDSEGNITTAGLQTINNQLVVRTNQTPAINIFGQVNGQDLLTANGNDVTTHIFKGQVNGDANARFTAGVDGQFQWGGGVLARDVTLQRTAAGILGLSAGSFAVTTAGQGLQVKEGANAKMGLTAAMVAGTVTVATTAVTASSRIFLTAQSSGAAPGALRVSAVTPGTSFVITSTSGTDTSTVAWMIMDPA